jgi:hypothetical protein
MLPIYILIEYHNLLSQINSHLLRKKIAKFHFFFSNFNETKTKANFAQLINQVVIVEPQQK